MSTCLLSRLGIAYRSQGIRCATREAGVGRTNSCRPTIGYTDNRRSGNLTHEACRSHT